MKRTVRSYLKPYWPSFILALGQVFLISALELLKPWPLKIIIDNILSNNPLPLGLRLNWSAETLLLAACAGLVLIYMRCPIRIYLETDPVVHQIRIANGEQRYIDLVAAHTALFTWGANYGEPDCGVPVAPFKYKPTRSPVILDYWDSPCNPAARSFTTIAHWDQSVKDLEYNGERYSWSKHREFLKILELPSRTAQGFSLALAIDDPMAVQLLEGHGGGTAFRP